LKSILLDEISGTQKYLVDREVVMAKRAKDSVPSEEVVQAEESAEEAMAVVPVKEVEPEPIPLPVPAAAGPSFGQRVRAFFNFLARLLLILIILGLIGVGVYVSLPVLYQRYVQPVQDNTVQLQQLSDQQRQSEQAMASLQTRLVALEDEQSRQAESLTVLDKRISEIETEIAARTESLETLEEMQATLLSQSKATNAELGRQINLLKGMELLSRARLFMYQSNFGLARQDVQSARNVLLSIQPEAPEPLAEDLSAVIVRLDLTLSNLPNFPVAASDDLDIAWQILLGGRSSAESLIISATSTPAATLTPNPEATGTAALSTAQVTPTP
jgi:hypothetical protein